MQPEKIAIITGASRGIGAATARLFAQQGYAVCINFLKDDIAAEQLKNEIQRYNINCIAVKADVSKSDEVQRLFDTVDKKLGCLSVLVNNVGILKNQCRLDEIDEQRFSQVMTTNVMSCFLCSKQAVKRMSSKYGGAGGSIINVSSGASKSGSPNEYVDYAASKGAIDSLSIGLAKEVAAEGIRVNAVRPGLIHTDIHSSGGEPNRIERLKTKIPMQRGGEAIEVAEAIYWLASEKSSFSTGGFIDIAGGL
jgi:NAD(P)-dependent dehydrogenase (short-subunit alcohol dehydrogenase family)